MEEDTASLSNNGSKESEQTKSYKVNFNKNNYQDIISVEKKEEGYNVEAKSNNETFLTKALSVIIQILKRKQKQSNVQFNVELYRSISKCIQKSCDSVFFKNNDLYIEKIFIATLGTSAKTGEEEWMKKEISKNPSQTA